MRDWDSDSELWDDEDMDDPDERDDGDSLTRPCSVCGAEVYEDAEQCPQCGEWLIAANSPWEGKPIWWTVLGLMGVAAVLYVLLF